MHIGVCKIKLYLPESQSLKDKRRIVKSLIDRLKKRFNLAVAELDALDMHQSAIIGAVSISNDVKFVNRILSQSVKFIEENSSVVLVDYETDFFF